MSTETAGEKVRRTTSAMKLGFKWFGVSKRLEADIRMEIAELLSADPKLLRLGKALINTSNAYYRRLTKCRSQAMDYWRDNTLPYVEKGVRLLSKAKLTSADSVMKDFRIELQDSAYVLNSNFSEVVQEAKDRLGSAYRMEDYPTNIANQFDMEWTFPNIEPPSYLMDLDPELYRRESERVAAIMEQIPHMAEKMFAGELQQIIVKFTEAMKPSEDGTTKKFRSSTVETNFLEFFKRFKELNPNENSQLLGFVKEAEALMRGVTMDGLRTSDEMRASISSKLLDLGNGIESQLGVAPRRKLTKKSSSDAEKESEVAIGV